MTRPSGDLARQLMAEAVGTALLLAAVVGSGIMGERLAGGNVALALLANTAATGTALIALILAFGSVSGAHFNPAVTLADAWQGGLPWQAVPGFLAAQVLGAILGVATADLMFGEPVFAFATRARSGPGQLLSEFVATFGLMAVIWGCARRRPAAVPFAVGAYISAAYWFTASTSFANPAVTLGRALTDTFTGIRPADVPGFVAAQLLGAGAATALFGWLVPALPAAGGAVVAGKMGEGRPFETGGISVKTVLFACTHNAGRSQMAATFFNALADPTTARAVSAGTDPADRVHPEVLAVMREVGLDLSAARPRRLTPELAGGAQWLVTMGCGDACPVVPGARREDWPIEDPKGQPLDRVRGIREEIRRRVERMVTSEAWASRADG